MTRRIFDEILSWLEGQVELDVNASDRVLRRDELRARAADSDGVLALLTDAMDADLLRRCPRLRIIANFAVGFNNIDIPAANELGILVTNTPGVLTETTADFAWGLLLATARRVLEGDRLLRAGGFEAWGPRMLLGHDVHGKVLGVIGFGRIGQAVARRAAGFDMEVLFYTPRGRKAEWNALAGARAADLGEIYRRSDFISLHAPLTAETHYLLDDDAFQSMKPNCIVINTARGALIDEKALVRALENGVIAGAGLDVYEHEPAVEPALLEMDNVVLAPHIASASYETRTRMCRMAAENLVEALHGRRPPNLVNEQAWNRRRL